jgi:hypothetical protein
LLQSRSHTAQKRMQQTIAQLQIKNGDNRRRGLPNTQRAGEAQPHYYSHTKPLFGFASQESVTPRGAGRQNKCHLHNSTLVARGS